MTNSYLSDLHDQPQALQATLDSLAKEPPLDEFRRKLDTSKYRHVILTGMGSSFHGLYPLLLRLFHLPLGVIHLETAELLHYAGELIHPENLVIAVSQSGESAEIVQLLEQTEGLVDLIGVTNTAQSALARRSSRAILTCAGEEATVSCKTYIAGLAAEAWLGDQLLGGEPQFDSLAGLPEQITSYWMDWPASVEQLSGELDGVQNLYLLGRGRSLAAALAGALIIKEASRFGAEGMSCAAFRHGPLELASDRTMVFVFRGDDATAGMNTRLVEDILNVGGLAHMVEMGTGNPPFNLPVTALAGMPLLEIMLAQMTSLALANLNGHEAGTFQHASKVTTVE